MYNDFATHRSSQLWERCPHTLSFWCWLCSALAQWLMDYCWLVGKSVNTWNVPTQHKADSEERLASKVLNQNHGWVAQHGSASVQHLGLCQTADQVNWSDSSWKCGCGSPSSYPGQNQYTWLKSVPTKCNNDTTSWADLSDLTLQSSVDLGLTSRFSTKVDLLG